MNGIAARSLRTDVVIAGAGPVGLLLACELRRAGVPVVIVERLATPMTESRASQLSTLSAELLHERGFDALIDEAEPEGRAHFGGLSFDLSGVASEYAGNWKVPQYRTEAALGDRAAALGTTLCRAFEVTEVTVAGDRVTCVARGPAETLSIDARYLVGCDGAQSTVRRLREFTASVTPATKELLRADIRGVDIRDRRFERLDGGFAAASTRGGITRVMVHAKGHRVLDRVGPPEFGEVARLWRQVTGEDVSGGEAIWVDAFDNSSGQADRYRQGPVFLAGDAAHWHMPIGGQALNIGLADAVNLGWKLGGVVNGWASPRLLDSYHEERHPVAARALRYVAAQEAVLLGGEEFEPLRAVLGELIGLDDARDHLARVVSGLDDRYGPVGDEPAGRRVARAIGTEPVVLRHAAPAASRSAAPAGAIAPAGAVTPAGVAADEIALPGGFSIKAVRAAGVAGGASSVLVRPDGYIAWAGDDEAALRGAIDQLVGDPSVPLVSLR